MAVINPSSYPSYPNPSVSDSGPPQPISIKQQYDVNYLKSFSGILKIVETLLNLISVICIFSGPTIYAAGCSSIGFSQFVSVTAFINTLIWLLIYLCSIFALVKVIPWLLVEMIYLGIITFFYCVSSIISAVCASNCSSFNHSAAAYAVATVVGFAATVVYAVDFFTTFKVWRSGNLVRPN